MDKAFRPFCCIVSINLTLTVKVELTNFLMEYQNSLIQGPVVQSLISANPGLTLNKTYGVLTQELALTSNWALKTGPRFLWGAPRVLGDRQHGLKMWQQTIFKAPTSEIVTICNSNKLMKHNQTNIQFQFLLKSYSNI